MKIETVVPGEHKKAWGNYQIAQPTVKQLSLNLNAKLRTGIPHGLYQSPNESFAGDKITSIL